MRCRKMTRRANTDQSALQKNPHLLGKSCFAHALLVARYILRPL